jgi:hypothetical protein
MAEEEFEMEGTDLVEVKTLSRAPEDYAEVNSLLKEGWTLLDVKVAEFTQEKNLKDGPPYVSRYPKVVWVLGKFAEE